MFTALKKLFRDRRADWKQCVSDEALGTLRLSGEENWWESTVVIGERHVLFQIGGDGEPSPVLIAQAHDALGNRMTLGYDAADNQTTIKNSLGKVTTTVYDSENRRRAIVDPLGNRTSVSYDQV